MLHCFEDNLFYVMIPVVVLLFRLRVSYLVRQSVCILQTVYCLTLTQSDLCVQQNARAVHTRNARLLAPVTSSQ